VLLSGQHDDDKDELSGEQHLNEEALRNTGPSAKGSSNSHWTREQGRDHASGGNAAKELGNNDHDGANCGQTANEKES
jgi:hypothetical protein